MFFLLRAVLVIGALTYFAPSRSGRAPSVGGLAAQIEPPGVDLAKAWNAIPPAARETIAREGAAELARRIAALQPSQDTLAASDRVPPWKGVAKP